MPRSHQEVGSPMRLDTSIPRARTIFVRRVASMAHPTLSLAACDRTGTIGPCDGMMPVRGAHLATKESAVLFDITTRHQPVRDTARRAGMKGDRSWLAGRGS
jgi:hypothetical protein